MRYEYDREVDVLTIILSDAEPDLGEQSENIITHYGKDVKPIEIEILDASRTVLELLQPILARAQHEGEAAA